jgi:hypothetical protein
VDATEAQEGIEDAVKDARTRRLALLIAALLAIVGVQDDNSAQDAVQSNIQASDLWAFFQAKSLRQFVLERDTELLQLERDGASPDRREAIDAQLQAWKAKSEQYESDPKTQGADGAGASSGS